MFQWWLASVMVWALDLLGLVSTWLGDHLCVGKPFHYVTSHPGQLGLDIHPWLLDEDLVWLIGAVVCLHVAPQVQSFASMNCPI